MKIRAVVLFRKASRKHIDWLPCPPKASKVFLWLQDKSNMEQYSIIKRRMLRKEETNASRLLNSSSLSMALSVENVIEKEIDNYTRLLEQDKRKYFRVQQANQEIGKELGEKVAELENAKSKKFKTEMSAIKGKLRSLESHLEQAIHSCNEAVSKNNRLKNEIDELRKEKRNQIESYRSLEQTAQNYISLIERDTNSTERMKENIKRIKTDILRLQQENQDSATSSRKEACAIQEDCTRRPNEEKKNKNEGVPKGESFDPQVLLRHRLKRLIPANKEKIKIIDQYTKNMQMITTCFEEIKEESGINNLEDITNAFIKQEEQNMFVFQFINRLQKELEEVESSNSTLTAKIAEQQKLNKETQALLNDSEDREASKKQLNQFVMAQQANLGELKSFFDNVGGDFDALFATYDRSYIPDSIGTHNIEQLLAGVEDIICEHYNKEVTTSNDFKSNLTKYTKTIPAVSSEELKEKIEEKLMDPEKLREFASEYWEKRQGKTKNNEE